MNRSMAMRYYPIHRMVEEEVQVKPELTITRITEEAITFSDGSEITYWHNQECCEWNYADFCQIDDLARGHRFHGKLQFEACDGGFRFGDSHRMFFVPCYSEQNGYYTNRVCIDYKGKNVLSLKAEWR